ncbi:MAG: class I SAM-dependent methyltransferase [Lachnospiraceae bacterium]|nr:class I SAM-dependent methyltransferase [Lachnospiraceae bacterium]
MDSYMSFAEVYDLFMDNVPYDLWTEHVVELLDKYNVPKELVAELGCGTGAITRRMQAAGYDMIGVDLSNEMLMIAREAQYEVENPDLKPILYLEQDMRELDLFGSVRAVISICDSMNYMIKEEDLKEVFERVYTFLDPDGVFLFDMNTLYKYRNLLAENTFAENREEGSFVWENYYEEETRINEYDLTLYIRNGAGDIYSRFEETHLQRGYELEEVVSLLEQSGFTFCESLDADTMEEVRPETERMYIIAKK